MKRKSTRLNSPISPQSNIRKHLLRFSAILSLLILAVVWSANAAAQTYNFSILEFIGGTFSPTAKVADAPKTLNNPVSSDSTVRDLMFGKTGVEPLNVAAPLVSSTVVINEIYGGGGNTGATYNQDYVELYNLTGASINLLNYTLQYASATGATSTSFSGATCQITAANSPGGTTIPANGYYLIAIGPVSGTVGAALTGIDTTCPTSVNLAGAAGKIALSSTTTTLNATNCPPTNGTIVDFVGYGSTATCSETAPAPGPNANTYSMQRIPNGTDSDSNLADFDVATGTPKAANSSAGNTPPTISDITNKTTSVNTATGNISFTINDTETVNTSLIVTATSSNQTLVPDSNITLGGTTGSRTINITPATNQTGTTTITVTVSDGTTTTSDTFVLTVSAPATAAPVVNDPANGSLINTATPTYNGTAVANSTVTVYVDGVSVGTTTATAGGFFSLTQPNGSPLSQGSHTVYATAQTAGSTVSGNSNTNTFTIDSIAPNAPVLITPANGSTTNDNTPTYSGTAEPGSTVTIYLAEIAIGQVTADNLGNFSYTDQNPLSNATFTVRATATDAAGNTSVNSNTNTFTVDTIVPTVSSIVRASPNPTTSGSTVLYTVTFTEAVTGVDASDFALTTGVTGASIQSISGSGTTYTVTVNTGSGTGTIRLDVTDDNSIIDAATNPLGGATLDDGDAFGEEYDVNAAANTAPTISDIPNQSTPVNTATGDINFTVGDAETPAASLTVTATSSNQTLVPDANITLGGSGANRTINITPATNQTGTSTITVTVSDGITTTSDTFVLTVTAPNTAPTISDIPDQSGTVGTPIVIAFTVGDAETAPANLTVTATSSNPAVAPNPTITDNGGGNRSVNISPSAPGQTTITITVTDEGGLTATDTFVLTVAAPAPMIRNVDDDGMASDTDCDAANSAFTTIQSAVNAANAGDTIKVCPGTYVEEIDINKQLTILGPNATINPNTGTRVEEAIIMPSVSNPDFSTGPFSVAIRVSNTTFNGFTLNGNNPALTSGVIFNGEDVDIPTGIEMPDNNFAGINNPKATIVNNIIKNYSELGIDVLGNNAAGNENSTVQDNKIDNIPGITYGGGIYLGNNGYANVTGNVITRVSLGIVIENFSQDSGTAGNPVVGNNQITARSIGIRPNNMYSYTTTRYVVDGNTINSYVDSSAGTSAATRFSGVRVESIQIAVPLTVSNNSIDGNQATLVAAGYTRVNGIFITNGSTNSPNILITGNTITDNLRGISQTTPAVPTVTCNNIISNDVGVYVGTDNGFNNVPSSSTNGININQNNIVGNLTFGVQNDSAFITNAENNYWGAADGPGPVGPGSGDKVSTNVDFLPFLTAPSSCAPAVAPTTRVVDDDGMASATDCNAADAASTTIQGAVNAASAGDTIKVCPGTYTENVNVNKQLTILGPNAGVDPNTGTRGAEAIVRTAISNPVDATNCSFITNSIIVTLAADGITFNGFTLDGDNTDITSGYVFNGADIDAYAAIYGATTVSENPNHVVTNNIVKNTGEFGIYLNGTGSGGPRTGGSTLSNNKVDNVVGLCYGQGIRIDDGAFANIEDNVMNRVFSGIVVENFFTNTTPAPVVDSNRITAYGYAIYHNLHYAYSTNGFTYSNNTINSYVQANGNFDRFRGIMLESIQQQVPVTLSSNTIMPDRAALVADGYTRVDGIYITNTSTTSPNILITLNNISNALRGIAHVAPAVPTVTCNNITNNIVGVYVGTDTQFGGTPSSSTNGININQNNIVGNTTFGVQNDSSFVTNAENNYWGAPDGPGPVGPGSGDNVSTNVDFDPFLTALSSCAPTSANPGISINDVSVSEGDAGTTNATFTITLSAVSSQTVTVTVNTADNTATVANNDYQPIVNQVVTFNPGETVKTVTVLVNGDLLVEPDETFFVNLSNATNGTITDAQGVGTILNEFAGIGDGNGFEADTSPRPNGDTNILSDDVVQIRRFFNGTDTPSTVPNEFQRADSSPIATRGDGQILSDDVVQTRRYQNGTDAKQPAGGPIAPTNTPQNLTDEFNKTTAELQSPEGNPREVRVENAMGSAGQNVTVNIRVNAVGNESEYGFIINYDSTILSNPVTGAGTAGASVRSCNIATIGQVNCSVGGFPNNQLGSSEPGIGEIAAGTNQLLITVTFTIAANAQPGTTPLTLSNVNASSDAPQLFFPTATNGMVTILAPTAANVSIGGRVLTAEGRAVVKAQVTLTDSQGQMREARSNSFGYFKFTDLQAGETYIITIRSKQYTFSPKVVNATQDLIDVDFIALPNG